MRAWQVHTLGEPDDVLSLDDVAEPEPGPGELLVRVDAVALNFPDILLCRGKYQERPPLPFTPGLEIAGEVIGVGDGADVAVGTRVLGGPPLPRGGLAERVVLPASAAYPIPDSLSSAKAAALFITYQTGWTGLHRRAALQSAETLLVHAGAGGGGGSAPRSRSTTWPRTSPTRSRPQPTAAERT